MLKIIFKCVVLWLFELLPIQVSRWLKSKLSKPSKLLSNERLGVANNFCETLLSQKQELSTLIEIGTGKDSLCSIILASNIRACRIEATDIEKQREERYYQNSLDKIASIKNINSNNIANSINYRAPFYLQGNVEHFRNTDCVFSINTLEHIPLNQLKELVRDIYACTKKGGCTAHLIDYSDHWSASSSKLSEYQFLSYGRAYWKFFNPPGHFQNRLRHNDYISLFTEAGFKLKFEEKFYPCEDQIKKLAEMELNSKFRSYKFEDLVPTAATLIFVK